MSIINTIGKYYHPRFILALMIVGTCSLSLSLLILFFSTYHNVSLNLKESTMFYASLVNAIAVQEKTEKLFKNFITARDATLAQVLSATFEKTSDGKKEGFEFGEVNNEKLDFIYIPGLTRDQIKKIHLAKSQKSPMWRAVQGKNGVMFTQDFKGDWVLAGYHYIPAIKAGFVEKTKLQT